MIFPLSPEEVAKLKRMHKQVKDRRIADRFKAVLMRNSGKTWEEIAETLLLDDSTARRYVGMYEHGGLENLSVWECKGKASFLDKKQKQELSQHLEEHCYQKAADVIAYLEEVYGVSYSVDGVTKLMISLGFAYKKLASVPSGTDPEKQEAFVEAYEELKKHKQEDEVILFSDATHPHRETKLGRGWIKIGTRKEVPATSGRERINLLGAINLEDITAPLMKTYETINADAVIDFIGNLEERYSHLKKITVICDNARYYHAKKVRERLEESSVEFFFLPSYSPNLNPIERFWKFFGQYCLRGRFFPSLKIFRESCFEFFDNLPAYEKILDTWITDNFQRLDPSTAHSLG